MANSITVFFNFLCLCCASAAVVSKDGSGDYSTIQAAIAGAPSFSETHYTIHVRAGIYNEYLRIPYDKINIRLIGDGHQNTQIIGYRGTLGSNTILTETATVGFVAQSIAFVNAEGPNAGQGVALENKADKVVFYKCSFQGYQDTLWAASGRQFYRECYIYGTTDFIMGDGAAVFQNCMLYARYRKYLVFTAQSREKTTEQTGFVFQKCQFTMSPVDEAKKSDVAGALLGRPWRTYSRVVILKSYIDSTGWGVMDGTPTNKVTYIEFGTTGPGSMTKGRVKWPGVREIYDKRELEGFTVSNFINGDEWIPTTGVPYDRGL